MTAVKYFELALDSKIIFFEQAITNKSTAEISASCRLMLNLGRPTSSGRTFLMNATQSLLFYSVEVWNHALNEKVYILIALRKYRDGNFGGALRTILNPTVFMIGGAIHVKVNSREEGDHEELRVSDKSPGKMEA